MTIRWKTESLPQIFYPGDSFEFWLNVSTNSSSWSGADLLIATAKSGVKYTFTRDLNPPDKPGGEPSNTNQYFKIEGVAGDVSDAVDLTFEAKDIFLVSSRKYRLNFKYSSLSITSARESTVNVDENFSFKFTTNWPDRQGVYESLDQLPEGVTLSSDGTLSGVPSVIGRYRLRIKATVGLATIQNTFTLLVEQLSALVTIEGLNPGKVKKEYSRYIFTLGEMPVAVSVTDLPPGLYYQAFYIKGVPTVAGDFPVTITASNSYGSDTKVFDLHIDEADPEDAEDEVAKLLGLI